MPAPPPAQAPAGIHSSHIVATRNVPKGAEITNDYRLFDRAFCAAFLKKKK